ncbi:MAG TPA: hypothetical protein VM911_10885 [Pyrinomonadaceae bacterium]|jgi:hypothetical protein|nr:hypothetical protein [Pyrinomonadaceae bacterium]
MAANISKRAPARPQLFLVSDADVPASKRDALLESKQAKQLWEHRLRGQDQSLETYHFGLSKLARKAGWTDQEIVNLCIAFSRKHGEDLNLRHDYFTLLLARVKADEVQEQTLQAIEKGEVSSTDDALDKLSLLLGVEVTSIQRFHTDPRSYVMRLGNGSYVEFKTQNELTEQGKLAGALFDYANAVMPPFKNTEWKNVKTCIGACIEDVESSSEATHLGAMISYLRTYLRRHLRAEMERDGQVRAAIEGKPAVLDGAIWFAMDGLKRSILLESSEQPAKALIAVRLRQIGCAYQKQVSLRPSGEGNTSRSLWRVPDGFMDDDVKLP